MSDFNLNSILTTQPKSEPSGVQGKDDDLWKKAQENNPQVSQTEYNKAMSYVEMIHRIFRVRNQKGYQLASVMTEFKQDELYRNLGYDSFNEYVSDKEYCPFGRSSAYRYVQIGEFMDELDIGSHDFDEAFYQDHNVERIIEYDDDGNIDDEATRKANEVTSRVNFMDMRKIAGLYNKDKVNAAESRELMAKSIILEPDDFQLAIREAKGEENPTDPDDDLFFEGLGGINLTIGLGDPDDESIDETVEKAKKTFRELLQAAEDGSLKEELKTLSQEESDNADVEKIASKRTKYLRTSSGRYYGRP
jgi:hypothetical protein